MPPPSASDSPNPSIEELLTRSKPYLSVYLRGDSPTPDARSEPAFQFTIENARSGGPVVVANPVPGHPDRPGSRPIALSSRYDPDKEAARLLGGLQLQNTDLVLLLGAGNPQVLALLIERLAPNQICLAIDAHFALGQLLVRSDAATRSFLARPGCHLFAGPELLVSLRTYLEGLPAERLSGLRVLQHTPSQRLAPQYYADVEADVRDIIKSKMSDLLTRFEFERLWLKNILINSRLLPAKAQASAQALTRATVAGFAGRLAGMPGLLVSAGPSLRESLPVIREFRSRGLILACDTALKVLLKAGIVPHAVLTLDAQRHTLFSLQGLELPADCASLAAPEGASGNAPVLFADLVANPGVLRAAIASGLRGPVFSTTAQISYAADGTLHREVTPGTEHAEAIHGTVGSVQSGGSVATSAFDLLRTLGCDPIALIGQDLAYTGRRIHSVGTHHQERWLPMLHRRRGLEHIVETIVRKRKTAPVAAIARAHQGDTSSSAAHESEYGDDSKNSVLGDYVLNLYRLWFEQSIPGVDERVLNLSAKGAHIKGAEHPADPMKFVRGLPELSAEQAPGAVFREVRTASPRDHAHNRELFAALDDLRRALHAENASSELDANPADTDESETRADAGDQADVALSKFFERYSYLRPLLRRSEVYVKRNAAKLGTERAEKLGRQNSIEAIDQLWRGLRAWFG